MSGLINKLLWGMEWGWGGNPDLFVMFAHFHGVNIFTMVDFG